MGLFKSKKSMDEDGPKSGSLAIAYGMKKKAKKMAHGGSTDEGPSEKANKNIQGVHRIEPSYKPSGSDHNQYGKVSHGEAHRFSDKGWEKDRHHQVLEEIRSMPAPNLKGLAEGGDVDENDMVERILHKCMSKGGEVANSEEECADEMPNEFDDLALRDDLAFNYTSENSGDERGSHLNQEEDMHDRMIRKKMSHK